MLERICVFSIIGSRFDFDIYSSIVQAERSSWVQTTPGLLCPMKRKITLIAILRNKVNTYQSNERVMSDQEKFLELQHVMIDLLCQE